jgi:hypothetical protein
MIPRKWLGIVAALASFALLASIASRAQGQNQQGAVPPTAQSPAASSATPASAPSPTVYEDDRIRVVIPDGWTLSKPSATFTTLTGDSVTKDTETVPGALLTKGKYKLYLLAHHGQASGVQGGRFGEISAYVAPWLDTNSTCVWYIHPETTKVTGKLSRVDNYYDTAHPAVQITKDERPVNCGAPSAPGVFWYGSYFQQTCPALAKTPEDTDCGGYFLFYPDLIGEHADNMAASAEMTFSLSYDTTDPTASPRQGDANLQEMLDEASAIVKSITYK